MIYELQQLPGFLGTNATWLIDFNIIAQIVIYLILLIGISAQRHNQYRWHDVLQSFAIIANIFLIIAAMFPSAAAVAPQAVVNLDESVHLIPLIHGTSGIITVILSLYCFLAGWHILPRQIGRLRFWMWTTFVFWTISLIFGLLTYLFWYTDTVNAVHNTFARIPGVELERPAGGLDRVDEKEEEAVEGSTEAEEQAGSEESTKATNSDEGSEIEDAAPEEVDEHAQDGPPSEDAAPSEEVRPTESDSSEAEPAPLDPVLGLPAQDYQLVQGWYQGRQTFYYEFGTNSAVTDDSSQVIPALLYAFIAGFDNAGNPLFLGGQHNIVDIIPGDEGYADLWEVIFVIVPDDYVSNSFTSAEQVRNSDYELQEPGIYINYPIVPARSTLAEGEELLSVWYRGQQINYLAFGSNPVETAPIYAFITGFDDAGNPQFVAGQNNVIDVIPGDEGYSDFWHVNFVTVPADYQPNSLRSAAEVLNSGYEITPANIVLNCPVVRTDETIAPIEVPETPPEADETDETGAEETSETDLVSEPDEEAVDEPAEDAEGAEPSDTIQDTGSVLDQGTDKMAVVIDRSLDPNSEMTEPDILAQADIVQWTQLAATNLGPGARYEHALQYHAGTNQVYFFGGRDGQSIFNDIWVLDIETLTWRQLALNSPSAPAARFSTVMIVNEAGDRLYVATGHTQGGLNFDDVWRLDLTTEIWTEVSPAEGPTARYGGPGGNIGDNLILTHGFGRTRYDDTWQFNTSTEQWENITPAGEVPLKRCLFAATPSDNDLVIHGGCASPFGDCFLDDTWILDSDTNTWRNITSDIKPVGRQYQTLVAGPSGSNRIWLFGGQDASRAPRGDLWILNTATDEWQLTETPDGPSARYNHAAVWIPEQGLLIYGGRNTEALSDLWIASLQ